MASAEELRPLIAQPREDLSVEYKEWLDLSCNEHKATLAKAAIALANHGGGYIVIGFAETGETLESVTKPEDTPASSQDTVNNAINRYAEPEFQCEMYYVSHPDSGVSHPVILVPRNLDVPVMSRRRCQDVIEQNRCYIRKPGPKSETPHTSEEWRTLLNRCVRANRGDLLDAIRTIMTGSVEIQTGRPVAIDELHAFSIAAHDRWNELLSDEPDGSLVRFPHGYYEMAFSLIGAAEASTLSEIKSRLHIARRTRLSGWPPFTEMQVPEWAPYAHEDFVEAWFGRAGPDGQRFGESYDYDFWRASLDGSLYTLRGYLEDGQADGAGVSFYHTLPILCIGEGMLFAHRYAETFKEVDQLAVRCRFTGLKGRRLCSAPWESRSILVRDYISNTDEVVLTAQITLQQIEDNLAEVIHSFLGRLYEKFSFFELPNRLVARRIREMLSEGF